MAAAQVTRSASAATACAAASRRRARVRAALSHDCTRAQKERCARSITSRSASGSGATSIRCTPPPPPPPPPLPIVGPSSCNGCALRTLAEPGVARCSGSARGGEDEAAGGELLGSENDSSDPVAISWCCRDGCSAAVAGSLPIGECCGELAPEREPAPLKRFEWPDFFRSAMRRLLRSLSRSSRSAAAAAVIAAPALRGLSGVAAAASFQKLASEAAWAASKAAWLALVAAPRAPLDPGTCTPSPSDAPLREGWAAAADAPAVAV